MLAGSDRVRLVGLLAAVAACTPTRFDETPCSANAQCREAFGFGAMCGPRGMCQQAPLLERCGSTYPEDLFQHPDGYRDAIVLGTLMDRASAAHLVRERAIRLAIKEVNAAGGLDGRPVGLVSCDTQANPQLDDFTRTEASVIDGRYLARTLGVAAVVGPCASGDVEQVWDGLRAAGTLIMSPSATSPALGQLEPESSDARPGRLWRVAPSDALQGRLIAQDLLARKVPQVAVIREAGPYGEGLARLFTELFTAAGGAVQVAAITDETQIQAATAGAAAGPAPEVLFISSQQDWVVKFLRAARGQAGFESKSIFLTDAAANQAVLDGVPDAAALFARVRGTRPAPRLASDYVYASFVANYRAEYQNQDPTAAAFSAHAYDAAWAVLYGTAWSLLQEHGISARGTGRGLRHLSTGTPTPIIPSSWLGVVAAFRSGRSVNVSGASGELDFDPVTREIAAPLEVWTISALPHRIVPAAPPADPVEASRP